MIGNADQIWEIEERHAIAREVLGVGHAVRATASKETAGQRQEPRTGPQADINSTSHSRGSSRRGPATWKAWWTALAMRGARYEGGGANEAAREVLGKWERRSDIAAIVAEQARSMATRTEAGGLAIQPRGGQCDVMWIGRTREVTHAIVQGLSDSEALDALVLAGAVKPEELPEMRRDLERERERGRTVER